MLRCRSGCSIVEEERIDPPQRDAEIVTKAVAVVRDGDGKSKYLLGVAEEHYGPQARGRGADRPSRQITTRSPTCPIARPSTSASISRSRPAAAARSFAVLCLDLDRFKDVNDVFGHAAGDELLRRDRAIACSAAAGGGVLARLGGDEFAV